MEEELTVQFSADVIKNRTDPVKKLRKYLQQAIDVFNSIADVILALKKPPQTSDKATQTWVS